MCCWPRGARRRASSRSRSWLSAGSGSRRTSGSGGWSSAICPRRSPARSAGSNCAPRSRRGRPRRAAPRSSGRKTSPGEACPSRTNRVRTVLSGVGGLAGRVDEGGAVGGAGQEARVGCLGEGVKDGVGQLDDVLVAVLGGARHKVGGVGG